MQWIAEFSSSSYKWLLLVVMAFVNGVTFFAAIDCLLRPVASFEAAGKQKKAFWLLILSLAVLVPWVFGPLHFLAIIGVAAAIIYLVDVRPALKNAGGKILRKPTR